jgi:hypothetical protein
VPQSKWASRGHQAGELLNETRIEAATIARLRQQSDGQATRDRSFSREPIRSDEPKSVDPLTLPPSNGRHRCCRRNAVSSTSRKAWQQLKTKKPAEPSIQVRLVMEAPSIPGQVKSVWRNLWEDPRRLRKKFATSFSEIASGVGKSESSGRRFISELERLGLITNVEHLRKGGCIKFRMPRPSETLGSPRIVSQSAQQMLAFMDQEAGAEEPITLRFVPREPKTDVRSDEFPTAG